MFDAASKRNFQMFQNNGKWSEEGPANSRFNEVMNETAYPKVKQRLRTMDLFAGCGGKTVISVGSSVICSRSVFFFLGFSNGLERSGVAETLWAIEIEENAAKAFMLNHPKAQVFCEDCNVLLAEAKKVSNDNLQPHLYSYHRIRCFRSRPKQDCQLLGKWTYSSVDLRVKALAE